MNISDFVMLLGGVAMFLFGMAFMGEGLKKKMKVRKKNMKLCQI